MATNTKANTTTTAKRTTAPAVAAASQPQAVQVATGSKATQAATPQAPLYTVGVQPPVRPGTHRAYAQAVTKVLAKANPKGFTLVAYRAALVAGAAASSIAPPTGGWAAHNMPTWCANPKQAWLVPAGS